MIYVTSDVHGMFVEFMRLLNNIEFGDNDTLYVLGDVIDRGYKPLELIKFIKKQKNIKLLLGNHEYLMWKSYTEKDAWERNKATSLWLRNGGEVTKNAVDRLMGGEKIEVLDYIFSLDKYEILDKYILCHAGIRMASLWANRTVEEIMRRQDVLDILQIREEYYRRKAIEGKIVISGHTTTNYVRDYVGEKRVTPISIWYDKTFKDKIGIDCGACFEDGRLACLRLDDMQEFYI